MGRNMESLYEELIKSKANSVSANTNFSDDDIESFVTSEDYFGNDAEETKVSGNRLTKDDEESFVYKRFKTRREYKYTDAEMEAIRNSCVVTFVHDYVADDFYHVSDEDRAKYDSLAEISMKLGAVKSVYRRVDQYIYAMRTVYRAWDILASKNLIYTRDEFFKLVGKGKITSNKIILPVLKNSNKYNADKIMQYIGNEELDPEDLLPIKNDDMYDLYYDEDEKQSELERLFSIEELELIDSFENGKLDDCTIETTPLKRKYVTYGDYYSSSKKSKLSKDEIRFCKLIAPVIKEIKSKSRSNNSYGYSSPGASDLSKDDNEMLFEDIRFHGSWESDVDTMLYDIATTDILNDISIPGERNLTGNDILDKKFYQSLVNHGVNDIKIKRNIEGSSGAEAKRRRKEIVKENRMREEKFINRVTNLQSNPKFIKLVKKAKKNIETTRYADDN